MTIRAAFENILIELNKVQAPSLLLDDFIYLFNKGVQKYYNSRYNLFETKQQLTDDLRVLTKTLKITPGPNTLYPEDSQNVFGGSYRCNLPEDYVHILNCICEFIDKNPRCGNTIFLQGANKLDTTQWSHVNENFYMKPSVKRPYYYIINVENPEDNKTSAYNMSDDDKKIIVERSLDVRYGNSVLPTMLIKYGDDPRYELNAVYIDYLRAPKYLSLDQDLLDKITDESQVIEFPDYVVYEILDEIVKLIMENNGNPRIQTNPPINKSIA